MKVTLNLHSVTPSHLNFRVINPGIYEAQVIESISPALVKIKVSAGAEAKAIHFWQHEVMQPNQIALECSSSWMAHPYVQSQEGWLCLRAPGSHRAHVTSGEKVLLW